MATKLVRKKKKYLVNVKKVKGHEKYFYFMSNSSVDEGQKPERRRKAMRNK